MKSADKENTHQRGLDVLKIERLTPEQEDYLPKFRQDMFDLAINGKRVDRGKLKSAISDAYEVVGQDAPLVVVLQSPLQAMAAIKVIKTFAKEMTGNQLSGQLTIQLADQLSDQLSGQLSGQLWNQLYAQLWNQLSGQLWSQLGRQLSGQLRRQLDGQLVGQLQSQEIYNSNYLWGSQNLYWIGFHKFCEEIGVKYTAEKSKNLNILYRIAEQCEWWWPYEGICFVSEKPVFTKWDNDVLHNEAGPAVEYADGYSVYSWRGINVPQEWIEEKESLKPETALKWENMEQRRAACEILGWERILSELGSVSVNKDNDPQIGELVEVEIPDVGKEKFLRVQCGTGRMFALPVPPDMQTALQANAWTWGLEPHQYIPEIRT